jgi:hypothetical protein
MSPGRDAAEDGEARNTTNARMGGDAGIRSFTRPIRRTTDAGEARSGGLTGWQRQSDTRGAILTWMSGRKPA